MYTQQPVLERGEAPEELTGASGAQIWSFFNSTPERTAAVGDDLIVTAANHPLWELSSVLT